MPTSSPAPELLDLVATCPVGLEEFVASELEVLDVAEMRPLRGAVLFRGSWNDVARCNLQLSCANRVLVELTRFGVRSDQDLARGAGSLVRGDRSWSGLHSRELFAPSRTLSVHASTSRSPLRDVRWIAQRTKDGLVDAQRIAFARRSSVDAQNADTPLRVLLRGDEARILLDTSAQPLDHRGYRVRSVDAPLREHLAAACVRAAGELSADVSSGPIYDPMCGSGTLLAEAGAARLGLPAGRLRQHWMFEELSVFDRAAWGALRRSSRADSVIGPGEVTLCGVDQDEVAVRACQNNLEVAGFGACLLLHEGDAFTTEPPPGPGLLLVNPPYGERIASGEPTREAWRSLGDLLKQRFAGWTAVVLAGGEGLGKHIGLRPRRRYPVRNGPLEARILVFDLY